MSNTETTAILRNYSSPKCDLVHISTESIMEFASKEQFNKDLEKYFFYEDNENWIVG